MTFVPMRCSVQSERSARQRPAATWRENGQLSAKLANSFAPPPCGALRDMESDSEEAVVVPRGARRAGAAGAPRVDSDDEELAVPMAGAGGDEADADAGADADAPRPVLQRLKRLQTAGAAAAAAEAVRFCPPALFCLPGGLTRRPQASPGGGDGPAASGDTGAGAGGEDGEAGGGEGEEASEYEESEDEEEALERHVAEKGTLSGAGDDGDGEASGAEGDDGAQPPRVALQAPRRVSLRFSRKRLVCSPKRARRAARRRLPRARAPG